MLLCPRFAYLDEGEDCEHCTKLNIELLPENRQRKARFHNCLTDTLIDPLNFSFSQLPEEDLHHKETNMSIRIWRMLDSLTSRTICVA